MCGIWYHEVQVFSWSLSPFEIRRLSCKLLHRHPYSLNVSQFVCDYKFIDSSSVQYVQALSVELHLYPPEINCWDIEQQGNVW